MGELTLELSLEGGVDLGSTKEENGRWTFGLSQQYEQKYRGEKS